MATEGKVPFFGFKAGAVKFITLFGFSPKPPTLPDTPTVLLSGSGDTILMRGSGDTILSGSGETVLMGGSVGD